MLRQLTKRFMSRAVSNSGKSIEQIVDDIGSMDPTRMAEIIRIGNPDFKDIDQAHDQIDNYLADESNSIISLMFTLLEEFDKDWGIFRGNKMYIQDIKDRYYKQAEQRVAKMKLPDSEGVIDKVIDIQDRLESNTSEEATISEE